VAFGEVGDRPELVRLDDAVRDPDAHHEVPHGLALAALAADRADAVALCVDAPPAEVRPEPLGWDRVPALPREALDLGMGLPGVQLALEPLHALRLRLLDGFAHRFLREPKAGSGC